MDFQSSLGDLERPPSKANLTIFTIIEICFFTYLGITSVKNIYDLITKSAGISSGYLLEICIYGLLVAGFFFVACGFFQNSHRHLKTGLLFFVLGLIGKAIFLFLRFIKTFSFVPLIELCVDIFFVCIAYKQSTHC